MLNKKASEVMETVERQIAGKLLQIKAIKLQPANPFTWASRWKSPIYCDNRKTLSYHDIRTIIKTAFTKLITTRFPEVTAIAGVATGAIAQGVLVADHLQLPFAYIRATPKGHGLENLIEGELNSGAKVVVVEDLVSTGGSSLKAVKAVRNSGCEVIGLVAIFTYGFPIVEQQFKAASVPFYTLSDYNAVIEEAARINYIEEADIAILQEWRKDPANWAPK